jgi:hypothetical protein
MKMAVFWVVVPCILVEVYRRFTAFALMMEAASTSETSANFYEITRRNIPEGYRVLFKAMFFPWGERPSFTPTQNNRLKYSSV